MKPWFLLLVICFGRLFAADESDAGRFVSPDGVYSVEVVDLDEKDPRRDDGERALVVSKKGTRIARVLTMGYILDAFWSPDGKYVAVNNRNANSGDYLWVFSLKDGKTIKKPFDKTPRSSAFIRKKYPEFADEDQWCKEFIVATGWTEAGELKVRWDNFVKNQRRYPSAELCYKVVKNRLALVRQDCIMKVRGE